MSRRRKINKTRLKNGVLFLTIWHKGAQFSVKLDPEDYPLLKEHCWRLRPGKYGTKYAVAHTKWKNGVRRTIRMHRIIMGIDDPKVEVDHQDRDGLNNRKINLQLVTKAQNVRLAYSRRRERRINNLADKVPIVSDGPF